MVLRSNFSGSKLVRLLGGANAMQAAPARQDVAERLGLWLNVADAITLHAALQSIPSVAQTRPSGVGASAAVDLAADVQQVRAAFAKSIGAGDPGADGAAEYGPYHQRYLDQQRRMHMRIDALRVHARQVLSKASPRLAQLAALDTALGDMLGGREQQLLSTVPAFLKKRFALLQRENRKDASAVDDSAVAHPKAAWLTTFEAEFQTALLAELDLRLTPVTGMLEALSQPTHH